MAQKITTEQLKELVATETPALSVIEAYVELDPTASIPRLRVRPDALLDPEALGDYDVDQAVFDRIRELEERDRPRAAMRALVDRTRVVAEGDSWFRHVRPLRPRSIAQVLKKRFRRVLDVENLARWGHTLSKMLEDREYMPAIETHRAEFFIFSGGGNDFVDGIRRFIHDFEQGRRPDEYLTDEGEAALEKIGSGYRGLLGEVTEAFSDLEVLCYGYDYVRPLVANGPYIGQHLRRKGIPDDLMGPILDAAMEKMNAIIKRETEAHDRVEFIDCLRATDGFIWLDDMHPGKKAFRLLASKFAERILE